jgi:hypothetical protein
LPSIKSANIFIAEKRKVNDLHSSLFQERGILIKTNPAARAETIVAG